MTLPLVLSMGDPAGIGPELAVKAWQALRNTGPAFAVVGDPGLLGNNVKIVSQCSEVCAVFPTGLPVLSAPCEAPVTPGQANPANSKAILHWIEEGVRLVRSGEAAALVTNPIAKAPLYAAGFRFPGHTEFLGALTADLAGPHPRPAHLDGPVMMLAVEGLRVALATVHVPLADVPGRLNVDGIMHTGRVLHAALQRDFAIPAPRIAVAGLNPHAGEDGTIGREDADIVAPAVAALQAEGIDARGPYPADSLFHADARARFDAVLCLYHDQGLIPIKTLDFWGGVNVTLGLPIVRTSPDHGTGFDIAGKGLARPDSLIAALRMAARIAENRSRVTT